jgi:integrase
VFLTDLYDRYEKTNRTARSPQTRKLNRLAFAQFLLAIGDAMADTTSLSDDNLALLESHLLDAKKSSVHTVNRTVARVKAFWTWCCRKGHAKDWPSVRPLPAPEPYRRCWTSDQVRQLLTACDQMTGTYGGVPGAAWWRTWHVIQWETGERTGAMRQLRWDWIQGNVIDVPAEVRKGHKRAIYRVSAGCVQQLDAIRHPQREMVLPWDRCMATFYYQYRLLLRRANLPTDRKCKPQRMRRSHLTYWHLAGLDASARAQHSSPAITVRHYLDETLLPQLDPSTVLPSILEVPDGQA